MNVMPCNEQLKLQSINCTPKLPFVKICNSEAQRYPAYNDIRNNNILNVKAKHDNITPLKGMSFCRIGWSVIMANRSQFLKLYGCTSLRCIFELSHIK